MITAGQGVGQLFTSLSVCHLFIFWYLLLSVVALKLTSGTAGLGGHSHPGEPEARPPTPESHVMSESFWSGQGQTLGWTKEKRNVSHYFCSWQQLFSVFWSKWILFVFPSAAWITGAHSCWQSLQVRLAAGSSLSSWMLLHIIAVNLSVHRCCYHQCCHFWWLTECQGCNNWNNYLQKVCLMALFKKPVHYGLQNIIVWIHSSHGPTFHIQLPAVSFSFPITSAGCDSLPLQNLFSILYFLYVFSTIFKGFFPENVLGNF